MFFDFSQDVMNTMTIMIAENRYILLIVIDFLWLDKQNYDFLPLIFHIFLIPLSINTFY